MCLSIISVLLSVGFGKKNEDEEGLLVVTSFYPVYIAARNVTDGIDGVTVQQLSQPSGGCVHDYQLTTQDMLLLEKADIFIINGAGMENYLSDVMERYPELDIVDSSDGTMVYESEGGHTHGEDTGHVHEEDEHDHEDNAHIWMDMDNYCIQIGNIGNALAQYDNAHKQQYQQNEQNYVNKVQKLKEEGCKQLSEAADNRAVSTHEAFSYFVHNFGWSIGYTINMDENTSLSAAQVGEVVDAVNDEGIAYVLTEQTYGMRLSEALEQETEAETVILDTLVSGEDNPDAYLEGMRNNIKALWEVAKK